MYLGLCADAYLRCSREPSRVAMTLDALGMELDDERVRMNDEDGGDRNTRRETNGEQTATT